MRTPETGLRKALGTSSLAEGFSFLHHSRELRGAVPAGIEAELDCLDGDAIRLPRWRD
jgi:hypothetical protein